MQIWEKGLLDDDRGRDGYESKNPLVGWMNEKAIKLT